MTITNSLVQIGCQHLNLVKMTGSHFALEPLLVTFVFWPCALATLCEKCGQNSCILVVSQPLKALRRSAFLNLAATGIWSSDTPLWWRIEI